MKLFSILILLTLGSCLTGKIAVKTGIEQISFGNGGGFTGQIKTYTLTADSKLIESGKELASIDSKETLMIFNEAKDIKDYSFNESGNMYSYIEIKTENKTNRIVWAIGSTKVDKNATELHKKLMTLIK